MTKNTGIPEDMKKKIIGLIKALIPDAKIYLYGSRARGDHHARSDIDIALDAGRKLERIDVGEVKDVLEATNIMYHFDVLDLHNIPDDLRTNILKDALLWSE